jgi:multicomponent Na+:H+ antiporter subunit D
MVPYRKFAWSFACIITALTTVIALKLAYLVSTGGVISYAIGNWQSPIGIEYKVDMLSAFFLVIVSIIGFVTCIYSYSSLDNEIDKKKQPLFYGLFLLCFAGLLGIVVTNDAFNIYVFLEISSLAAYGLIAMGKDRRSLIASFEYLVLGTIGATFILIAIGMLYMMTGTLNISDLFLRISGLSYTNTIKAALAFFAVGLALKIAVFPLHVWLANAYTNAPSFVSSFLSGAATKVAICVLIKMLFLIFGYRFSLQEMPYDKVLITISLASIFIGALVAIFQRNIKRMLAYSSISQVGYILLAIGLVGTTGIASACLQVFSHAMAKTALFMACGGVLLRMRGVRMENFKGIGRTMPFTAAAFLISGLSMIGIPFTAGFIGKVYLLQALVEQQGWLLLGVVLISSLLSVVYIWRVVEVMYFSELQGENKLQETPILMLIPMWALVIITLVFGVYSAPVIDFASKIAVYLFGF